MRKLIIIASLLLNSLLVFSQEKQVVAEINENCISQPGNISIEKDLSAIDFKVIKLEAGKNCYNGQKIKSASFNIKNSSGKMIYKHVSEEKLKNLILTSGIYTLYVDGGREALLQLKYQLKKNSP